MSDQQVTDLLQRATADLRAGSDLVDRGIVRGRRRRRRHLVGTAAASVALLGIAGTGVAVLGSGEGSAGRGTDTPVATAPAPTPSATPEADAPRLFGVDPAKTGWVLGSLLTGEVSQRRAWSDDPDEYRAGSVLLDGAQVTILVTRMTLPECGEQAPDSACMTNGDGFSSTSTYDEPAPGGGRTGVRTSTATFYTADHFAVTATAYNAPSEKGSEPIQAQPVLSEQQLLALVNDPVWFDRPQ